MHSFILELYTKLEFMEQIYLKAFSIIIFLLLAVIVVAFLKKLLVNPLGHVYKPKGPYLLSAGEKRFFDVLSQVISTDLYICPKVRLADLIEVNLSKSDKNFWKTFNQISQKHVDFVLCNKSDFAPRLVVELDGGSHYGKSRTDRDTFVDNVFRQASIPIIHVKVSGEYSDLSNQITQRLRETKIG